MATRDLARNLLLYIFSIYFIIVTGTLTFILIPLTFIVLRPVSKKLCKHALSYWAELGFYLSYWGSIEIRGYADENFKKFAGNENFYGVVNHHGELDWMILGKLANYINMLKYSKMFLIKHVKYFPGIGWLLRIYDFQFLSRSYEADFTDILRVSKVWSEYEVPFAVGMFPEGSRFTEKQHIRSKKFAQERGLEELNYHLTPRTKGFTTAFPIIRNVISAVYDLEFAYDKAEPTILNMFNRVPIRVHVYARRIPVEDVPYGKREQELFLYNLFNEKDRSLESFHRTGNFLEVSAISEEDVIIIKNPPRMLVALLLTFTIVTYAIYYVLSTLHYYEYYYTIFVIAIVSFYWYYAVLNFLDRISVKKQNGRVD